LSLPPAPALGIYVHWPYCARICPYCDFNVVRNRSQRIEQAGLVEAILADLIRQARLLEPRQLVSIFFGGGTPSLMAPESVARIVEVARSLWPSPVNLEVTLEANPTDAESGHFAAFARAGVTRLSLGLQSLDDRDLQFLGRNHDAAAGRRAIELAKSAFRQVSVDLIYALPGQTSSAWAQALSDVISLGVRHISPYQLTIEPATALHRAVARGRVTPPGPDLAADLFETTQAVLKDAGFEAYEISNHAREPEARAAHNLIYWRGEDYIGLGPGAHGRLTLPSGRHSTAAPRAIKDYLALIQDEGQVATMEPMDPHEIALERLFMGLRTLEGVSLNDLIPLEIKSERLEDLADWIISSGGRLHIRERGRPVLDRVIALLADSA
jgi:oxygen-independent coproporphyrinogen-3 oxidase